MCVLKCLNVVWQLTNSKPFDTACKYNILATDVCAQVHKGIDMLYAEKILPK